MFRLFVMQKLIGIISLVLASYYVGRAMKKKDIELSNIRKEADVAKDKVDINNMLHDMSNTDLASMFERFTSDVSDDRHNSSNKG